MQKQINMDPANTFLYTEFPTPLVFLLGPAQLNEVIYKSYEENVGIKKFPYFPIFNNF